MSGERTTDALLLRSVEYRESDRILTLFTQAQGKVSALARGARASKRRFQGVLEPYAIIRVELTFGRGELATLKSAAITRSFSGILADLTRMQVAGAGLALVRELSPPHVSDAELFASLVQYLAWVDLRGDMQRAGLLAFAMRILALSGLAPQLDVCGRTGEAVPKGRAAFFDPALGAVVSRRAGGGPHLLSGRLRGLLLAAQQSDWAKLADASWNTEDLNTARSALSAFLAAHLSDDVSRLLFDRG